MASTSGSINLFLRSEFFSDASGTVPMSLFAATSGYSFEFGTLQMSIPGVDDPESSGSMNMYLSGVDVWTANEASMNLILNGIVPASTGTLNLTTIGAGAGTYEYYGLTEEQYYGLTQAELYALEFASAISSADASGTLKLFIQSAGVGSGTGAMNVYLKGNPLIAQELPLYMNALGSESGTMNLYTFGVTGSSEIAMNLYLASSDTSSDTLELFARGYIY